MSCSRAQAWPNGTSLLTRYLAAFHSVNPKLAADLQGGIYSRTDAEQIFSVLVELAAGLIFGILLGQLSSMITAGKVSEQRYTERMDSLREFLRKKKVPLCKG